jgi:hypothetical protein
MTRRSVSHAPGGGLVQEEVAKMWLPLSYARLAAGYPRRPLSGVLARIMADMPPGSTPCCLQLSHAFSMAGGPPPPKVAGLMRGSARYVFEGTECRAFLTPIEVEVWLTRSYGPGMAVRQNGEGRPSRGDYRRMLDSISGKQGALLFRSRGAGFHVELWDGQRIHQRDIDQERQFAEPRVLFWRTMLA